jgi:hypothetical protein
MAENPHIPILICGSKKDLVQYEDIKEFEDKWFESASKIPENCNIIDHIFISSKTMEGIDSIFYTLADNYIFSIESYISKKI